VLGVQPSFQYLVFWSLEQQAKRMAHVGILLQ
jgi:hypothetical protein